MLNFRLRLNTPIPNNPFYSPPSSFLYGDLGKLNVGTNLSVDPTGTLNASGGSGGGGTVTNVSTGIGLTGGPVTTTGTISLANTTVAPGSYTLANITVDAQGRVTAATSGTPPPGGTVTRVSTGTGLIGGPITNTGTIELENTAVTPGSYTNTSITVDAQGRITAASTGAPGGVTAVTATAPLASSGGSTPAISLATSGVTPGIYTNATVTVNGFGIISLASSGATPVTSVTVTSPVVNTGTATAPIIGVQDATTGQKGVVQVGTNISVASGTISVASSSTSAVGVVQLNDTLASTSVTEALTAKQGKSLQDQITALAVTGTVDLAGTIDASTGLVASVTSAGVLAGYTVGAVLPAAAAATVNSYVIVTTAGTMTPPGGTSTVASTGDWFLVNQTAPGIYAWSFLNVGVDIPTASTGTAGIVQLATNVQTQTGTDATLAITPAGAAATYVPISSLTGKGAIISASAANTPATLAAGTNGYYLVADSAETSGLKWAALPSYIPASTFTAAGQIIVGTGTATYSALPVGTNGTVLLADSTCVGGLTWYDPQQLLQDYLTAKGSLITASAAATPFELTVGTDGQVLSACSTETGGLCWVDGLSDATPLVAGKILGCTGLSNTSLGCNSSANTGVRNISIGGLTLFSNTVGEDNVAVGAAALRLADDSCNVAVGSFALCCLATGDENTVVGYRAGVAQETGSGTTAIGSGALLASVSGCANTALGVCAGVNITTGSLNVAIGPETCVVSGTGSCQLVIGIGAGFNWLTGDCNKNIKPGAGILDCCGCVGTDGQILSSTSTSLKWINKLSGCTTTFNTSLGCNTPSDCGFNNTAIGVRALRSIAVGSANVAVGVNALQAADDTANVAVGFGTFSALTVGANNTAVGTDAGVAQTIGYGVTAIGSQALCASVSGPGNTALGVGAGGNVTTGCFNVALGPNTNVASATGDCQLAIGFSGTCNWLTGDCDKNIRPGAGLIDCRGCVGVSGQVLTSTGTNILWSAGATNPWNDAGAYTVGATGVPPTYGNVLVNKHFWRQVGAKDFEVIYRFNQTTFASVGVGDYLFSLPSSLKFDLSLAYQPFTNANLGNTPNWMKFMLPGPTVGQVTDGVNISNFLQPAIYDATRFRMVALFSTLPSPPTALAPVRTQIQPIGGGFFSLEGNAVQFFRFTFTAQ